MRCPLKPSLLCRSLEVYPLKPLTPDALPPTARLPPRSRNPPRPPKAPSSSKRSRSLSAASPPGSTGGRLTKKQRQASDPGPSGVNTTDDQAAGREGVIAANEGGMTAAQCKNKGDEEFQRQLELAMATTALQAELKGGSSPTGQCF